MTNESATPFLFVDDTPWCVVACSSCNTILWHGGCYKGEMRVNTLLNLAADAHAMDGVWDGG